MDCHTQCGVCCIIPEISAPLPNMPNGKPAGEPCINLDRNFACRVYTHRPSVCREFKASHDTCGNNPEEAIEKIRFLDEATR